MSRCLIVTAKIDGLKKINSDKFNNRYVICADGGYLNARDLGLPINKLIGDFDSAKIPSNTEDAIILPMEKDMTDTEAALDMAVDAGFDDIIILGGLGGRFDHTMGNVALLAKYCGKISSLLILDGQNEVSMHTPGTFKVKKDEHKYFSLISYGDAVYGLNITGAKYPLCNSTLSNKTTLGISNEITEKEARISFSEGALLLVRSKDID